MKIFTCLFCILMTEVKGQTKDIFPAKLLAPQKILSENSKLYVVCSTFGMKKRTTVWVYLCIDGVGVEKHLQRPEENDTTFTIEKVKPEKSGKYSCVYSQTQYKPSEVNATGNNQIRINVIANFQPADLSLSGPSSVNHGEQVEFVCSLQFVLRDLDCDFVQSYLIRDRVIYQVQGFDVNRTQARFVIRDALQKDSGQFSCVVRPSQCFKEDEGLSGNNVLVLQVKEPFSLGLTVLLTVMAVILLLGVFLFVKQRRDGGTSRTKHSQVNRNLIELQRPAEREQHASDAQDTFSVDEELTGYQNVPSANDPYSYVSDLDPTYDEILPSAGSSNGLPSEPQYAMSKKKKKEP